MNEFANFNWIKPDMIDDAVIDAVKAIIKHVDTESYIPMVVTVAIINEGYDAFVLESYPLGCDGTLCLWHKHADGCTISKASIGSIEFLVNRKWRANRDIACEIADAINTSMDELYK